MSDEFWKNLVSQNLRGKVATDPLSRFLKATDETPMAVLTDKGRKTHALALPVSPGVRVSFRTNLGSVMAYTNPPNPGVLGTVVMVRTAEGDSTFHGDNVFVKWDDGQFLAVDRQYLRQAKSTSQQFTRTASSLGDLSEFMRVGSENELIHKSTKDLWKLSEHEGQFIISRLFTESGEPLKV